MVFTYKLIVSKLRGFFQNSSTLHIKVYFSHNLWLKMKTSLSFSYQLQNWKTNLKLTRIPHHSQIQTCLEKLRKWICIADLESNCNVVVGGPNHAPDWSLQSSDCTRSEQPLSKHMASSFSSGSRLICAFADSDPTCCCGPIKVKETVGLS